MLEYLSKVFRAEYLVVIICSAVIFFPVYRKYVEVYKSLISYEQKKYILVLEFIIFLTSLNSLFLSEMFVAIMNVTVYSIYVRTYKSSVLKNRKLKKNIKAYGRYMKRNWDVPVKLGRIDENNEEGKKIYSSLLTFDEFVKRECK